MRRLNQVLPRLLVVLAVLLMIDYTLVGAKEKHAAATVSLADGRLRSIPCWPLGSEYRVTFDRPLALRELEQVTILNTLRGSVWVAFYECQLTEDQMREAADTLHQCIVFQVIEGRPQMPSRAND